MVNSKKYIASMFSLVFFVCTASFFVDLVGILEDTRTKEEKEDLRKKFESYKEKGYKNKRIFLLEIEEAMKLLEENPDTLKVMDALSKIMYLGY